MAAKYRDIEGGERITAAADRALHDYVCLLLMNAYQWQRDKCEGQAVEGYNSTVVGVYIIFRQAAAGDLHVPS